MGKHLDPSGVPKDPANSFYLHRSARMQHGIGDEPQSSTHPTARPYGTPEGDLVVFTGSRNHYRPAPLNALQDGTSVVAAGQVDGIRMHGTPDEPRATFMLLNAAGQATYAAVDTLTYDDVFGYLLENSTVSLTGICRRPFEDGPPYIQVIEVQPVTD